MIVVHVGNTDLLTVIAVVKAIKDAELTITTAVVDRRRGGLEYICKDDSCNGSNSRGGE